MKKQIIVPLILMGLSLTQGADAKLYKWIDDNGRIHYGDKIPAEFSDNQHEVLDNSGKAVKKIDRAKSKEELAAARAARTEEQKRKSKERLQKLEKARQDKLLLDTFTEERDIILMRDDKINSLESGLVVTKSYNKQLKDQLLRAQGRIDSLEKAQRKVPDNLYKQLASIQAQLDKNNAFLDRKNKELTEIRNQFEKDLKRFRELKGITTPTPDNASLMEQNTRDLTEADVKELMKKVDESIENMDASAFQDILADDVRIVLHLNVKGHEQTIKMKKAEYIANLKQGWATMDDYVYKRLDMSTDLKKYKATIKSSLKESMTVQGQKMTSTTNEETEIQLRKDKPVVSRVTAHSRM